LREKGTKREKNAFMVALTGGKKRKEKRKKGIKGEPRWGI